MVGTAPWLMIHSDLPLITPRAIEVVADACESTTVIVPSYDGGTTVIASRGSFDFSYGIGSFQRHYASAPEATIISSPELSIDIDTPHGLELVRDLLGKDSTSRPPVPCVPLSRGTSESSSEGDTPSATRPVGSRVIPLLRR